jgi:hypothetical protein
MMWVSLDLLFGVLAMVLCPVAIAVGCKKCPVFGICPVKSVIGDYKPDAKDTKRAATGAKKSASKK